MSMSSMWGNWRHHRAERKLHDQEIQDAMIQAGPGYTAPEATGGEVTSGFTPLLRRRKNRH
jgi:hypothetical protein